MNYISIKTCPTTGNSVVWNEQTQETLFSGSREECVSFLADLFSPF